MKKFLSLFLAVLMIMSVMAVPVSAITYYDETVDGVKYTYFINSGEAIIAFVDAETAIGDVVVPDKLGGYLVTIIDKYAFEDCNSMTSITVPDTVEYIRNAAFIDCTGLESVTLPKVLEIRASAFGRCANIKTLTVSACAEYGSYAFSESVNITDITLKKGPEGHSAMNSFQLSDEYGYCYKDAPWYVSRNNDLKITIEDGVTTVGTYAFYDCTGLKEITIPGSVTGIGTSAFEKCINLETINVASDFTLNKEPFNDCTALKTVKVAKGSTGIIPANNSDLIWYKLPGKEYDLIIEDGVTEIGDYAFNDVDGIKNITFPESVKKIGTNAFYNTEIENVHISNLEKWFNISYGRNSTPLIEYAKLWLNGELLTKIVVPDGVEKIGDNIFSLWKGLTDITIPDSVTSIGSYAFNGCTGLKEIVIPDSVTTIGDCAFQGCKSLEKADLPDSVTTMGSSVFKECKSLKEADIPKSLTAIEYQTYLNCESLTSVVIPYGVKTIGRSAFQNCYNLESVTIPDSVTTIKDAAFGYCKKISGLTLSNNVKYLGTSILYGNNVIHYVGISSDIEGYEGYSRYNNIHYIPDPARVKSCSDGPFSLADDCEICAEWISKNNRKDLHSFSEYKSNGDATCLSDGTKTARCNNTLYCDMEDTIQDVGSKKGHSDSDKDGVCNECGTDFTIGCGHICHKGGIEGFFYKIALFFWKLFKTNKVCSCGIYHY